MPNQLPVFVLSAEGKRLMPTFRRGRVRHLLRRKEAKIVNRNPFTIQLCYESTTYTQEVEMCVDTGYQHIGVSIKSESREYVSAQYDLLPDEKERHDDQRKYRRTRRNRKRYRKPRFDNRRQSKPEGWMAPSIRNKANCHVDIIRRYTGAVPIARIVLEIGQFDVQVLSAFQEGRPIPEGSDYQHGERYGIYTLREAVFQRDGYKCRVCGRSNFKDGAILHAHHMYFWRGQHGNRLSELITACEKCHTSANHQPGGKLYGLDKRLPRFDGATFMNQVKWYIYERVRPLAEEVRITYGVATKLSRMDLGLEKSHAADAYSMGQVHPEVHAETAYYKKRRRNNRSLESFYDAKVIDRRTGKKVSGAALGCERTNRREARNSEKSLRRFRGEKVSAGHRNIRRTRYPIQPGDMLLFEGQKHPAKGCHCLGSRVILDNGKSVAVSKVTILQHTGGWTLFQPKEKNT